MVINHSYDLESTSRNQHFTALRLGSHAIRPDLVGSNTIRPDLVPVSHGYEMRFHGFRRLGPIRPSSHNSRTKPDAIDMPSPLSLDDRSPNAAPWVALSRRLLIRPAPGASPKGSPPGSGRQAARQLAWSLKMIHSQSKRADGRTWITSNTHCYRTTATKGANPCRVVWY